jgi:hypothetical protein
VHEPQRALPGAARIHRTGNGAGERFVFAVDYRLREYLGFVLAHALHDEPLLRTAKPWQVRSYLVALGAMATVIFAYKKIRMGRCHFVVDAAGISRRTRRGTSAVAWDRVRAIHRYPPGWLLELHAGAVPLPERALPDGASAWLAGKAAELAEAAAPVTPVPAAD